MARLAVVPPAVRLRVALLAGGALGLLGAPLLLWPPPAALLAQLVLVGIGLYALWCLWPRFTLGLGVDLGAPPLPPGQFLRLSFDDGPTPGLTDRLLDLLAERGVRASFFVLVPKARASPCIIERIVREGHALGLHGADHRGPFLRSAAEIARSLAQARAELEALAGRPVTLYRPSHGRKTVALVRAARRAGLRLCFWDYGVWDTDAPPLPVLLRRLAAVARVPGAPVLLLHDGRGDPLGMPPHGEVLLSALRSWLPSPIHVE